MYDSKQQIGLYYVNAGFKSLNGLESVNSKFSFAPIRICVECSATDVHVHNQSHIAIFPEVHIFMLLSTAALAATNEHSTNRYH